MIDILIYLTMIVYVQPSLCEQELAFKPVPAFHLHYLWRTDNDSGFTPFLSCVPPNAIYTLRYKEL